jgi:hypothetical protein
VIKQIKKNKKTGNNDSLPYLYHYVGADHPSHIMLSFSSKRPTIANEGNIPISQPFVDRKYPNGVLLLNLLTSPNMYMLDPETQAARIIYTFPNALSVLGTTEVSPDVFAVAVGNYSIATASSVKGSYSVWKVDFNSNEEQSDNVKPTVAKVVDISEAAFLNGMETLTGSDDEVLVADSGLGAVWKVDVSSGKYEIVIQIPEIATAKLQIGINGLHLLNGYLYWTNSEANTFYRAKVDQGVSLVPGTTAEPLANSGTFMDDFIFDDGGMQPIQLISY